MELKKLVSYRIPFSGRTVTWCCALLGLSVFLRYLYYFVPCDPDAIHTGVWILRIILPTLLCGAFGVLLRLVRLRSPGVYGILAAAMCLMLMAWDIMDGNVVEIILSVLTLPFLGFLSLATFGGYIPFRSISCFLIAVVLVLRLFFGGSSSLVIVWMDRISELSILASLFCFSISLKPMDK